MQFFSSIKTYLIAHKVLATILVLVLGYGGYYEYKQNTSTANETRYVTGVATKGTIITSISGSGQVSTSNQVDLKPKVSGEVLSLPAPEGSDVAAGSVIARLDSTDAQKAVRDAQVNLESAMLALKKLREPADTLALTQSQNSLDRAKNAKQNAEDDLAKAYDDGFNSIANAFLDLPSVMSGLHDILFLTNASLGGMNVQNIDFYTSTIRLYDDQKATIFGSDANTKYQDALAKYTRKQV